MVLCVMEGRSQTPHLLTQVGRCVCVCACMSLCVCSTFFKIMSPWTAFLFSFDYALAGWLWSSWWRRISANNGPHFQVLCPRSFTDVHQNQLTSFNLNSFYRNNISFVNIWSNKTLSWTHTECISPISPHLSALEGFFRSGFSRLCSFFVCF